MTESDILLVSKKTSIPNSDLYINKTRGNIYSEMHPSVHACLSHRGIGQICCTRE